MTKWEYLTAPILTHSAKQILDNFGSEGWELVQIAPGMNPENLVGYFKRPARRLMGAGPRSGSPSSGSRCRRWPKPVAAYVPALRSGNHVFTSGQLPMRDGELMLTGKVGGEVDAGRGVRVRAAVRAQRDRRGQGRGRRPRPWSSGWSRSSCSWPRPPTSPASRGSPTAPPSCSATVFGDAGVHARSAVGVAALPLDAPVEVEIVVEV